MVDEKAPAARRPGRPRKLGPSVGFDVRLPADVYAALAALSSKDGESMGEHVRRAVKAYLERRIGE